MKVEMNSCYDEYVSLGDRCETAFQIQRVIGKKRLFSSFFNWNVTSPSSLLTLLSSRFLGILELENLTPNEWLVHDSVGDYMFHLVGEGRKSKDHPQFVPDVGRHREKVSYVIEKYLNLAASGARVCYFYRHEGKNDVLQFALELKRILLEIHKAKNFSVVIIQDALATKDPWIDDIVFNRYLKRLAPIPDQSDGHILSWDEIFKEFPHSGGISLCDWL